MESTERKPVFNRWGTHTFEPEFMLQTIGFGEPVFRGTEFLGFDATKNPSQLNLHIWLSFVPEVYRGRCELLARSVSKDFAGEKITDRTIEALISKLLERLHARLQPA